MSYVPTPVGPALVDPWALFSKSLEDHAEGVALVSGDREVTYDLLSRAVVGLSARLQAIAPPQSGVAVLLGMLPEFVAADLAILRSDLVKVPLNPMLSGTEMAYIVEHSGATVLLTSSALDPASVAKAQEIAAALPAVRVLEVSIDELVDALASGTLSAADGDVVPARPEDRAAIYYTGGTTGKPKGVIHSRAGVAATVVAHVIEAEVTSSDVLLLSTALSHSAGAFAAAAVARGARCVLLTRFTPETFSAVGSEAGATFAMVVPTMLYRLLDFHAAGGVLPPLRTLVYGSAPVTPSRLREAIEAFGPILIQLFGQTECPNWGTVLTKADHAAGLADETLLASCGRRSLLADVKVIDDEGRPLGAGATGEICLTAPFVMTGYLDNPEATADTLVDGWVHTRDIGEWDDRGYLFIKDRKADMIITGGYNVYSSEVEAELQKLDGVAQVAVIGVPDPDWGEAVCAVVVPRPGASLTPEGVIAESRTLLGSYKRVKQVVLVEEMPLTPFGKADKKALRAPYWADQTRAV